MGRSCVEAMNALVSLMLRAVWPFDVVCRRLTALEWRLFLVTEPAGFLLLVEAPRLVECFVFFAVAAFPDLVAVEDVTAARPTDPHRPQTKQASIILRRKQFK
jgi:hypothetical protein